MSSKIHFKFVFLLCDKKKIHSFFHRCFPWCHVPLINQSNTIEKKLLELSFGSKRDLLFRMTGLKFVASFYQQQQQQHLGLIWQMSLLESVVFKLEDLPIMNLVQYVKYTIFLVRKQLNFYPEEIPLDKIISFSQSIA